MSKGLDSLRQGEFKAIGGWRLGHEAFSTACLAPLLSLLHDLVLEFEGETENGKALVDFLHHLGMVTGIWENGIDIPRLTTSFPKKGDLSRIFSALTRLSTRKRVLTLSISSFQVA